jgi:hypothetical protein
MNSRRKVELTLDVLRVLWPEGIQTLEYPHLLRVIKVVGEAESESSKVEDSLSSAQDRQWATQLGGG